MWLTFLYVSGALQWIAEHVHPLMFILGPLAILCWRMSVRLARQRIEIQRLQAQLFHETLVLNHVCDRIVVSGSAEAIRGTAV